MQTNEFHHMRNALFNKNKTHWANRNISRMSSPLAPTEPCWRWAGWLRTFTSKLLLNESFNEAAGGEKLTVIRSVSPSMSHRCWHQDTLRLRRYWVVLSDTGWYCASGRRRRCLYIVSQGESPRAAATPRWGALIHDLCNPRLFGPIMPTALQLRPNHHPSAGEMTSNYRLHNLQPHFQQSEPAV